MVNEHEFDVFARNHLYASFLQSIEEYRIKKEEGYECYLVGVKHEGVLVAAAFLFGMSLMRVYRCYYAPRGLLVDYQDEEVLTFFMENLKSFLRKKKGVYLKFDPYVPYVEHDKDGAIVDGGFDHHDLFDQILHQGCLHGGFTTGFSPVSQARWMMVLDLKDKTEQDLIKDMDQLRKRIIKKVDHNHVIVSFLAEDELHLYEKIVEETCQRKGFMAREHAYNANLYKFFTGDQIKIAYARLDVKGYLNEQREKRAEWESTIQRLQKLLQDKPSEKAQKKLNQAMESFELVNQRLKEAQELLEEYGEYIPLASCLFILYGKEIVYLSGGSYHEFSRFNGPYSIQWYMIRYALAHGYERYNFYGTSGEFHKGASDYGVYEFKRGFHAVAVELLGDFYLPIKKGCFHVFNKLKHIV